MKRYLNKIKKSFNLAQKTNLIHIGKCGGTTIENNLNSYFKFKKYHHTRPNLFFNHPKAEYIILVRNPISRFVSSFNFSKAIIDFDISKVINPNNLDINNCIAPDRIRTKMKNSGISFSKEYDELISNFDSANSLAESLYSEDFTLNQKAIKLMEYPIEHLYKGIGWYLHNGKFVSKYYRKILKVIRIEYFDNDFQDLINKKCFLKLNNFKIEKKRQNKFEYSTFLSNKAIENIICWYSSTDYKALKELFNKNLIEKSYLDECFYYKNK